MKNLKSRSESLLHQLLPVAFLALFATRDLGVYYKLSVIELVTRIAFEKLQTPRSNGKVPVTCETEMAGGTFSLHVSVL